MDVLYIDVYFLLNFTVDILSFFFSSRLLNIKVTIGRLILVGVVGAILATLDCFINGIVLRILLALLFFVIILLISRGISILRRLKLAASFFLVMALLGGIVSYFYAFLDRILGEHIDDLVNGATNRAALIFSIIILLSIGVLRILIMLFSGNTDGKNVRIKIEINNITVECDALLDSGNLVKDPMSMCPVLFIKKEFARTFLPHEIIDLENIDSLGYEYNKRIRLVPITRDGRTHVLTGVRVDSIFIVRDKSMDEVDMTVVIDKEEGDFGGFYALAPSIIESK